MKLSDELFHPSQGLSATPDDGGRKATRKQRQKLTKTTDGKVEKT